MEKNENAYQHITGLIGTNTFYEIFVLSGKTKAAVLTWAETDECVRTRNWTQKDIAGYLEHRSGDDKMSRTFKSLADACNYLAVIAETADEE
jgi:hypothetical protein